ncbi:ABC transporter ATP-binding protein [Hoeflea sp. CAU 1731]
MLALEGVNWRIRKGEFVSFVGPSGSGKTTMLKLITGAVRPTKGVILQDGQRLEHTPQAIGMAFQDALLLPWRNVMDNVLLPVEIRNKPRREVADKAEALLATVGLSGFEKRAVWELSGGMRQRVSLCRALINDPEILLLDEPFAALDAFTREDMWLVLTALHQKMGCTTVLITHQINEAVFLSDRVLVVSKRPGRIVHEQQIAAPDSRTLDWPATPHFAEQISDLRRRIDR